MNQVMLTGWRPGFQKIPLTKLLQSLAGLTLGEAKSITDQILDGRTVSVSLMTPDRAEEFAIAAEKLGAVAGIASTPRTGTHG